MAEDQEEKIPCIGSTTLIHNGVMKDKAVGTLIREVDAQQQEEEYLKSKIPEHWNWIDVEARNTFHEGVGAGTLKYITGQNHYGCRHKKTNNELVDKRCPRCNKIKTWEHVMLCKEIETMKEKYVKILEEKIKKVQQIDHLSNQIAWMLGDKKQHLNRSEETEGNTTQSTVGISNLFRVWIVKNWINVQDHQLKKTSVSNKIILRQSVLFYAEVWRHRNEVLHEASKHK